MKTKNIFPRVLGVFFLALAISSLFNSCKQKEKAPRVILIDRSPAYLFSKMKGSEFQYEWINSKINAELNEDGKKTSFKINMRAKKDSIIWASIAPQLGIEIARAVITPDSIKFLNRWNSTFFEGDFKFINRTFGVDLDFDMLQSALTGNPFDQYEEDDFKSFVDKDQYMLSTTRKRKLRRTIQKSDTANLVAHSIWLEPKTFKISRFGMYDFNVNQNLEIFYSNFTPVDTQLFPFKILFKLTGENPVQISLQYSKISQDAPQSLPFSIPEKYTPIQ